MKSNKINYYKDELNDEFSGANITPRVIDENYKYIHKNPLWNFASFLQKEVIRFDLCLLELPYCQKRESGDIVWVDCFVHSTGRKYSGI